MQINTDYLDSDGYAHSKANPKFKVLGALENEQVQIRPYRKKKGMIFADVDNVIQANPARITPKEPKLYKATSVFQIAAPEYEINFKHNQIKQAFSKFADTQINSELISPLQEKLYNYRNKIEYSFYKTDEEISFGFFLKGSNKIKIPTTSSVLNMPIINQTGLQILNILNDLRIGNEKYLILRASHKQQKVMFSLIFNGFDPKIDYSILAQSLAQLPNIAGFRIASSPKNTPSSRIDNIIIQHGDMYLHESLNNKLFYYGASNFFQVNINMFSQTLKDVETHLLNTGVKYKILYDLFAGVGIFAIYFSKLADQSIAIEISEESKHYAQMSAKANNVTNMEFLQTDARSFNQFESNSILFVDPPRAGLEPKLVTNILNSPPKTIVYLSCNPYTQAQDFNLLKQKYTISFSKGYNFFPRTTHVEHLLILNRK